MVRCNPWSSNGMSVCNTLGRYSDKSPTLGSPGSKLQESLSCAKPFPEVFSGLRKRVSRTVSPHFFLKMKRKKIGKKRKQKENREKKGKNTRKRMGKKEKNKKTKRHRSGDPFCEIPILWRKITINIGVSNEHGHLKSKIRGKNRVETLAEVVLIKNLASKTRLFGGRLLARFSTQEMLGSPAKIRFWTNGQNLANILDLLRKLEKAVAVSGSLQGFPRKIAEGKFQEKCCKILDGGNSALVIGF